MYKVYYDPIAGPLVFDNEGRTLKGVRINNICPVYTSFGAKCGVDHFVTGHIANISIDVEVVNEHPGKNLPVL